MDSSPELRIGSTHARAKPRAKNQNGKRKVVVVAREKGGQAVTKVFNSEAAGVAEIADTGQPAEVRR